MVFDNGRILHERNAFDPDAGSRHLRGTYVDRDDMYSTLRRIDRRRRVSALGG